MSIGRKNKYYYEVTDSEIFEEMIGNIGLTPEVETTNTTHEEMVQYNSSDWDFLIARAEMNAMLVFSTNDGIKIAPPDLNQEATLQLLYGGNMMDFELEMEARYQFETVNAYAWNAAEQELIEVEGSPPSGNIPGNVAASDLNYCNCFRSTRLETCRATKRYRITKLGRRSTVEKPIGKNQRTHQNTRYALNSPRTNG